MTVRNKGRFIYSLKRMWDLFDLYVWDAVWVNDINFWNSFCLYALYVDV